MALAGAFEFDAVKKASTPELIASSLRRAILEGAIAGGTQLKQNDVAARFGVSVVPVREALQRLIADGLAVLHPNRGVTVTTTTSPKLASLAPSYIALLAEPMAKPPP